MGKFIEPGEDDVVDLIVSVGLVVFVALGVFL